MATEVQIGVDLTIYDLDVIHRAVFSLGHISVARVDRAGLSSVEVTLSPISAAHTAEDLSSLFHQRLIDARIRAQLRDETATVRDLIFRQAFVEADL